jgi:uncharacterized membrane protein required for colicin V production
MNYLDIAVLFVIVLFIIFGYFQGLIKSLLSLLGTLAALAVAVILAQTLANLIGGLGGLKDSLGNAFAGMFSGEAFTTPIDLSDETALAESLRSLGLPSFIVGSVSNAILSSIPAGQDTLILAQFVGPMLANALLVVICFFLIFFFVRFIAFLLEKLFRAIFASSLARSADRALGAVFGVVKAYLCLCTIFIILGFLLTMPALNSVNEALSSSALAKTLYENNLILKILIKYLPEFFSPIESLAKCFT